MPARWTRPTHASPRVRHGGSGVVSRGVSRAACCVQAVGREAESWGLLADAVGAQGGVEA